MTLRLPLLTLSNYGPPNTRRERTSIVACRKTSYETFFVFLFLEKGQLELFVSEQSFKAGETPVSNRPLDTTEYIIEGMRYLPPNRRHTLLSLLTTRYGVNATLRLEKELRGKTGGGGGDDGGDGASEMGSSAHGSVASSLNSAFAPNPTYTGTRTPFGGPGEVSQGPTPRDSGDGDVVGVSEDNASLKFLFVPSDPQRQAFMLGMSRPVISCHPL